MTRIDTAPAVTSSAAATLLGLIVLVAVGPFSAIALSLCGLGVGGLGVGLRREGRTAVSGGASALFLGVVAGAVGGAPVLVTLFGVVSSVLAWETGQRAIDIGIQLGRGAETDRLELRRLATNGVVGLLTGSGGYLVYLLGASGQPLSALVLVLLAVLVLFVTLRRIPTPTGE